MWCFLCDRPAKWRIPVLFSHGDGRTFWKAQDLNQTLDVCDDCKRRVKSVHYDPGKDEHTVVLQSLT